MLPIAPKQRKSHKSRPHMDFNLIRTTFLNNCQCCPLKKVCCQRQTKNWKLFNYSSLIWLSEFLKVIQKVTYLHCYLKYGSEVEACDLLWSYDHLHERGFETMIEGVWLWVSASFNSTHMTTIKKSHPETLIR